VASTLCAELGIEQLGRGTTGRAHAECVRWGSARVTHGPLAHSHAVARPPPPPITPRPAWRCPDQITACRPSPGQGDARAPAIVMESASVRRRFTLIPYPNGRKGPDQPGPARYAPGAGPGGAAVKSVLAEATFQSGCRSDGSSRPRPGRKLPVRIQAGTDGATP